MTGTGTHMRMITHTIIPTRTRTITPTIMLTRTHTTTRTRITAARIITSTAHTINPCYY